MPHMSESCICDLSNASNAQVVPFGLFNIHLQVEEGLHFSGNQKWCCMWMSHVTWEWVMSHENESCHIWMSHVTCEGVMLMGMGHVTCERMMSHMNESCHVWMSHVTYEWVMSYVNESCHESCHIWMGHVTGSCVNESCHIKLCHMWMSHVTESCHIWMSHITRLFHKCYSVMSYGVATISRLLKIISLFCRIWSLL